MSGKGEAAQAAAAAMAAAAADLEASGEVPEAAVVAELGRKPLDAGQKDVLESLSNDEAIAARRVVKGLKLSKDELGQELLPEVRVECFVCELFFWHVWELFVEPLGVAERDAGPGAPARGEGGNGLPS